METAPEKTAEDLKKAYNLLWLRLKFPTDKKNTKEPPQTIPNLTMENMVGIAKRNPQVDVRLWIDSQRMTDAQICWLEDETRIPSSRNLSLCDLRTIFEYNEYPLYNLADNSSNWRVDKHSLIWRQVDAAKILTCLQGDYEQIFYSDLDITNLVVNSKEVQNPLKKHGIVLSGWVDEKGGPTYYENQLFGFDDRKREFFKLLYYKTLKDVVTRLENGYLSYLALINNELKLQLGIDTREIVFEPKYNGICAYHPEQNYQFFSKHL